MVNPVRLMNYLRTLRIDPSSCKEFPDEAFSACWGVVHYAFLVPNSRQAWLRAVTNASFNRTGTLSAAGGNKSFFYSAILHRKKSAFGISEAPPIEGVIDAAAFPWALDDRTFEVLRQKAFSKDGISGAKEITWQQANDEYNKLSAKLGLATPIAVAGGFYLKKVVQSYAPELLGLVSPEVLIPTTAAAFAGLAVRNWTIRMENSDARTSFEVDATRRQFDLSHPAVGSELAAA